MTQFLTCLIEFFLTVVSKGTFLRENSKQIIIDVIESLNLILVFSLLNNVHYIYRISEYISEVSPFYSKSQLKMFFFKIIKK